MSYGPGAIRPRDRAQVTKVQPETRNTLLSIDTTSEVANRRAVALNDEGKAINEYHHENHG
jgi:hypothetical protein